MKKDKKLTADEIINKYEMGDKIFKGTFWGFVGTAVISIALSVVARFNPAVLYPALALNFVSIGLGVGSFFTKMNNKKILKQAKKFLEENQIDENGYHRINYNEMNKDSLLSLYKQKFHERDNFERELYKLSQNHEENKKSFERLESMFAGKISLEQLEEKQKKLETEAEKIHSLNILLSVYNEELEKMKQVLGNKAPSDALIRRERNKNISSFVVDLEETPVFVNNKSTDLNNIEQAEKNN